MLHAIWEEPFSLEHREYAIRRGAKVMCREAGCMVRIKRDRLGRFATVFPSLACKTPFTNSKAVGIWA